MGLVQFEDGVRAQCIVEFARKCTWIERMKIPGDLADATPKMAIGLFESASLKVGS